MKRSKSEECIRADVPDEKYFSYSENNEESEVEAVTQEFTSEEIDIFRRVATFMYNSGMKEKFFKVEKGKIRIFKGAELVYNIYKYFDEIISIFKEDIPKSKASAKELASQYNHLGCL